MSPNVSDQPANMVDADRPGQLSFNRCHHQWWNISSIEIEDVLFEHPQIMEAAVVDKTDEKWGEHPCAFVSLKEGESMTAEEVISYCGEELARFKGPKTVIFGPLTKTSTGKVQKYLLREQAEQYESI